jgi:hypothetical protein
MSNQTVKNTNLEVLNCVNRLIVTLQLINLKNRRRTINE